jgi:ketosteroid isomerase-like protein
MVAKPAALPEAGAKLVFVEDGVSRLYKFLALIGSDDTGELALLLAKNARVVDSAGARWRGRDEIEKSAKRILGLYATQGVTSSVESVEEGPGHTLVASVLWENMLVEGQTSKSAQRMTVVLVQEGASWVVIFLQATPLVVP